MIAPLYIIIIFKILFSLALLFIVFMAYKAVRYLYVSQYHFKLLVEVDNYNYHLIRSDSLSKFVPHSRIPTIEFMQEKFWIWPLTRFGTLDTIRFNVMEERGLIEDPIISQRKKTITIDKETTDVKSPRNTK